MSFHFREASRSEAKPLIGLYAESGCGKTHSALLLARGFVGPSGKIGMIETESGRGEAFADAIPGGYKVVSMRENFSPKQYGEAITAAEHAKLDALIVDSASHEWEGAGGVLGMAAEREASGMKGPLVWQVPKMDHQRHFMLRLLQTQIPLVILCMRAKYPMQEIKKDGGKKEWVRSTILEPKQSDDILFEMFIHGWIDKEHKFHGTKYTREDLKQVLVEGEMITIETGRKLAAWAAGGATQANTSSASQTTSQPATLTSGPEIDLAALSARADAAALAGMSSYEAFFKACSKDERAAMLPDHARRKEMATMNDQANAAGRDPTNPFAPVERPSAVPVETGEVPFDDDGFQL